MRPTTRFLAWLAKIAGEDTPELEPRTPVEYYLEKIAEAVAEGGGGGLSMDDIADGTQPAGVLTLNATSIAAYAFYAKAAITQVIAPNAASVGEYAFDYCNGLTLVQMPSLITIAGNYAFGYINSPTCIMVFPNLSSCGPRSFSRGHIGTVDIGPNCSTLPSDTFYSNTSAVVVDTLILRKSDGIVTAATAGAINGLKDVYVPAALISAYTNADKWSAEVSAGTITLHAIEGSIYETQYADGTPIGG